MSVRPCNSLRINGVNFSFPEDAALSSGKPAASASAAAGNHPAPGAMIPTGGNTPAGEFTGQFPARDSDTPAGVGFVEVSEHALMVLQLVATYHGCSLGRAVEVAAFAYSEQIGLPSLLDAKILQGRAAVARLAHNQEVARSNRAPATSHNRESEEGREDAAFEGVLPEPQPPP